MIDWFNQFKENHRIARNLPLIGYLILVLAVAGAFYLNQQNRKNARAELEQSLIINCKRVNELSDTEAQGFYDSFRDLPRVARVIGIPLTEQLEDEQRVILNGKLARLRHVNCSVLPPNPAVVYKYPPIIEGKPIPKPNFPEELIETSS